MSVENAGFWYTVARLCLLLVEWAKEKWGRKTKRIETADTMFTDALEDNDEQKLTAAADRLRREKKR